MLICVLGASGLTGSLVAAEAVSRGHEVVACGRDAGRVREAVAHLGAAVRDVRDADVHRPDTLVAALRGADVAISTIGPYELLGPPVVRAALDAGVDLVDVTGEPGHVRSVHDQHDAAVRAGVRLLAGAGMTGAIGSLLAEVALLASGAGTEVHVAYVTEGGRRRAAWSLGTRRSIAGILGRPVRAYEDGAVEEPLGERRRLAWFPRPLGPRHAAAIPGIEAITVPLRVPQVRAIHTYLAMPAWQAELLQGIGNLASRPRVGAWLTRRLDAGSSRPQAATRGAVRWAGVAEARGDAGIARAWAAGTDPYATAAALAVERAEALPGAAPGAVTVTVGDGPDEVLDRLSARGGMRWSVVRPEQHPTGPDGGRRRPG